MKRLVLQTLLVATTLTGILSARASSPHSEGSESDRIHVKIRAQAITDRNAFVYYHLSKTGDHSFFVQKYVNEVAKVATNIGPGQAITINAAFAPGRETQANTVTLTYGEAQRLAQSVKPAGSNMPQYACTWEPTFDLSAEA